MDERTVGDLMVEISDYATIREENTLAQALSALRRAQPGSASGRHRHRAVLVLDAGGRVVGKLTHWAVLRSLEPKLLTERDVASLSRAGLTPEFIREMSEGFPRPPDTLPGMCRAAGRIRVKDAMLPAEEHIEAETLLTDAIRYLVISHAQSSLVTREGRVVGILRLTDVFDEVARDILGE